MRFFSKVNYLLLAITPLTAFAEMCAIYDNNDPRNVGNHWYPEVSMVREAYTKASPSLRCSALTGSSSANPATPLPFFFQQYSTNGFYYVPSSYPEVKDQIYDFVISPSIYGYDQVQAAYLGRDNPQYKIKLYNDKGEVVRMYWAAPHASCYQNTDVKPGAVKKVTYSKRCYHHCKGLESP